MIAKNFFNLCIRPKDQMFCPTEFNEKWQTITIQKINSFDGFNASGFFTLGKPNLTSIVANFITFIIVLIQFNQSEPDSSDSD